MNLTKKYELKFDDLLYPILLDMEQLHELRNQVDKMIQRENGELCADGANDEPVDEVTEVLSAIQRFKEDSNNDDIYDLLNISRDITKNELETFFEFLQSNSILRTYVKYRLNSNSGIDVVDILVSGAFRWGNTDQRFSFWNNIDNEWIRQC